MPARRSAAQPTADNKEAMIARFKVCRFKGRYTDKKSDKAWSIFTENKGSMTPAMVANGKFDGTLTYTMLSKGENVNVAEKIATKRKNGYLEAPEKIATDKKPEKSKVENPTLSKVKQTTKAKLLSKMKTAQGELDKKENIITALNYDLEKSVEALENLIQDFIQADLEEKLVEHKIPRDVATSAQRLYDEYNNGNEYMKALYVKPEKTGGKITWFWLGFIPENNYPARWVQGVATPPGGNFEQGFYTLEALKKHLGDTRKSAGDLSQIGEKVALNAGWIKLFSSFDMRLVRRLVD
tara:strand:- start:526 stop:1413 length:888 start_codon:yes stop_codon:yes gene_type:complete